MFGNYFNGLKNALQAVVERSDVADVKKHWNSVQRYFRAVNNAQNDKTLRELEAQLSDVEFQLEKIVRLVADEKETTPLDHERPCHDLLFRQAGNEASMFVHACQLAKPDEPNGSRAVMLSFIVEVMAAGEREPGDLMSDIEGITLPLMDVVDKALKLPSGPANDVAVARVQMQLARCSQRDPRLLFALVPPAVMYHKDDTGKRQCAVDMLISGAHRGAERPHSADHLRCCLDTVVSLATTQDNVVSQEMTLRLPALTQKLQADLTSRLVTVCKVPDDPSAETTVTMCIDLVRFFDALFVCAPHMVQPCKLREAFHAFVSTAVPHLLDQRDDRTFTMCCTTLSVLVQSAVSDTVLELLTEPLLSDAGIREVLARCLDLSDSVCIVAMSTLKTIIDRAPAVACAKLLAIDAPEVMCDRVADINELFAPSAVQRKGLCGFSASDFGLEAHRRVLVTSSFRQQVEPALKPYQAVEAPVVKLVCEKLRCSLEQSFDVNSVVFGLATSIAALPVPGLVAALFGENHGPVAAALLVAKKAATKHLASPDAQAKYAELCACDEPGDAVRHLSKAHRATAACAGLEMLRHELVCLQDALQRSLTDLEV